MLGDLLGQRFNPVSTSLSCTLTVAHSSTAALIAFDCVDDFVPGELGIFDGLHIFFDILSDSGMKAHVDERRQHLSEPARVVDAQRLAPGLRQRAAWESVGPSSDSPARGRGVAATVPRTLRLAAAASPRTLRNTS